MKLINFFYPIKIVEVILLIEIFAFLSCLPVAIIYKEPVAPFIISGLINALVYIMLFFITKNKSVISHSRRREAYLSVSLSWIVMSFSGMMPYLLSHSIPGFTDALFESMSGFTTTGSSILKDIESLPLSVLFWRDLTHWIGGIGIIVLVIIIMPSIQTENVQLFSIESSLNERIQPRIRNVGIRLLMIYISLSAVEAILLRLGGMNWFESVCHTFGTISTGGFSPKNTSLSDYKPYIQYVVMIFMLLSGTSFVIHYNIVKGRFKKIAGNEELKLYLFLIILIGLIITVVLKLKVHESFEESFRDSFFQVISIITCTGFATKDYLLWPSFVWILLFMAMFLGGSTGSTSGGIKILRHLVLFKSIKKSIKQQIQPNAIITTKLNGNPLPEEQRQFTMTFVSTYVLLFIVSTIFLIIIGMDGKTSAGAVATSLAGIGPGLGSVGPAGNFSDIPGIAKITLSFLMLIGRLEIFTFIILFSPSFWKS